MSFISYSEAIAVYDPDARFVIEDNDLNRVEWTHQSKATPTKEQLDALFPSLEKDHAMSFLRIERDKKLADSDWRMTTDYAGADSEQWRAYRLELRNIPNRVDSGEFTVFLSESGELIFNNWPIPPAGA